MGGIGGLFGSGGYGCNPQPNPWDEFGPNSWVSPVMPFNSQDQQYNNDLATVDQATQNAYNGQYETHTYTDQNGIQHTTYSADGKNYNVYINQNGDRVVQVTTPGSQGISSYCEGEDGQYTPPSTTTYTLDPNGNLQVQQNNGFFGGQTNTDFQRESNPWCGQQDPYGQDPWDQVNETQTQDPPFPIWENPPNEPGFINYPMPTGTQGPGTVQTMMMSFMPGGGTDDG
ncbi:MAG: hypothetical protein M1421_04425 [Candidatus Eremiobacteraeota bacterium]|nr:hypothetical protein [Candidatus Eremiobacteraeota bacterium]